MSKVMEAHSPQTSEAELSNRDEMIQRATQRWARRRRIRSTTVRISQVLLIVVILGTWELMTRNEWVKNAQIFYGSPSGVYRYLIDNWSSLFDNFRSTLKATVLGFSIGSSAGVVAGLALGRWELADRVFDPVMVVLAGLPRIALAPLFLLWFGITDTAKVAVSVSAVFFVVLFNARAGVRSVDNDLQTVSRLLGANERHMFWKVILPGSVPVLFAGLRLAMIFSILGVIASEMVAARKGLGVQIVTNGQLLQPNGVFAALAILAATMTAFNGILRVAERRLLRWAPER